MPSDNPSFSSEQRRNAQLIINVGRQLGHSDRDIQIALMTAMQESSLRNLDYGDRDSLGLFQQRPSQGWGSAQQITDPTYATKKFYSALNGVKNRDQLSLAGAAQAVQRSAYPDAYAKWEDQAAGFLGTLKATGHVASSAPVANGVLNAPGSTLKDTAPQLAQSVLPDLTEAEQGTQDPTGLVSAVASPTAMKNTGIEAADKSSAPSTIVNPAFLPNLDETTFTSLFKGAGSSAGTVFGTGIGGKQASGLVKVAEQYLGTPYEWGGTNLGSGVDCSGFTQAIFAKFGVNLPRISADQGRVGKGVQLKQAQAGDLIFWDNSSRNNGADHVAIYIGNGEIIEAPKPGLGVRIRQLGADEGAWARRVLS